MKKIPIKPVRTFALAVLTLLPGLALHAQDLKPVPQEDIVKIKELIPEKLPAKAKKHRILVFWRCEGYVHGKAIEYGLESLKQLASKYPAYKIDFSREYTDLSAQNLKRYDNLVLMNTTRLNTKENFDLEYDLINFVKSGKGLTVIHAGADNFYEAEAAAEMVGGRFWGHPWTAGGTWTFKVEEPDHPLNSSFSKPVFKWGDEIYQQESPFYNRAKLHVLVSLDMSDEATANTNGQKREDKDNAVSWIRPYGKGRVFYTSFAHDQRAWLDKEIFTHMIAGMQYTLGDLKADDTPAGLSDKEINMVKKADELSLFKAFALLQDILRNTNNTKVNEANLAKLIPILSESSATPYGKQAVLRAFYSCGIQVDAPVIAPSLKVKETRNWAVTLLAGNESHEAGKILSAELSSSSGADTVNLINAMVIRKNSDAIVPFMNSTDTAAAIAAISGAGRIADKHALKALMQLKSDKFNDNRYSALAACIGTMATDGEAKRAAKAAAVLINEEGCPDAVMAACAKALLLNDPDYYIKGVQISSAKVRETLVRHADNVDNKILAASMKQACTPGKVAIITKLAAKNAKECVADIAAMLDSDKPEVVAAALKALTKLGSEENVPAMFAKLNDENGNVKDAAQYALEDMICADTSAALIKTAGNDIEKQKSVLKLLGERMKSDDIPAFTTFIKSEDSGVRKEAWKALGNICNEKTYPKLLALLPAVQESDALRASAAINSAMGNVDPDKRVEVLTSAWKCDAPGAKIALIDVMLRFSDDRYVSMIAQAMKSNSKTIAESATRALGNWPTIKPYNNLVNAIKSQSDASLKKEAYRGALKLALAKGGNNANKMCTDLFRSAPSDKDRETLANLYFKNRSVEAFTLLKGCFNDASCGKSAKQLYAKFYKEKIKPNANVSAGELDPKGWKGSASHNGHDAAKAYDRNDGSRWTSGQSRKGMWYTLDLGKASYLSQIVLDTSRSGGDTPNGYEVFVSKDGKNWGSPVVTAPENNDRNITKISLSATGRYIKMVLKGTRPGLHWSIHEIHIMAGLDPKQIDEIRKTAQTL